MKKIISCLFFIAVKCSGFGQSFQFIEPGGNAAQPVYMRQSADTAGDEFILNCVNHTLTSKSVKVRMTVLSTPAGCSNDVFFCDPIACYPASVHLSVAAFGIGPGDTATGALVPHIDQGTCCGDYEVSYCLFDVSDESDSVNVLVYYHVEGNHCTNGVGELQSEYFLGDAYPNPASGIITIPFAFGKLPVHSSVEIFSAAGEKIAAYELGKNSGELVLDPGFLSGGFYFYSLVINGRSVSRKKLLIVK